MESKTVCSDQKICKIAKTIACLHYIYDIQSLMYCSGQVLVRRRRKMDFQNAATL